MRRVLTLGMAAVMLAGIWSGGSFASAAGPAKPTPAKIDSKVLAQIAVSGQTTFFVLLKDKADVSRATSIKDWGARGKFVFDQLRQKADATQASLRSMLSTRRVSYRTYWIVNAIRVTGNQQLVNELAAQPEVDQILPDKTYQIPKPIKGSSRTPGIQTVEWNINDINAPLVWNTYGDRGEGILGPLDPLLILLVRRRRLVGGHADWVHSLVAVGGEKRRVVFLVGQQNFRSQKAMEKIGGVRVGFRPVHDSQDHIVYQISAAGSRLTS